MPRIVRRLGLTVEKLPDYSNVCNAKNDLYTPNWRRFLDLTANLQDLVDIHAIDASGFDRIAASRKYINWTDYTFTAMKTTVLVDCVTGTILDAHCTTKRPHDTRIGRQVMNRDLDEFSTLTADKGYDSEALRCYAQVHNVKPVFKHRNQSAPDYAQNHLQDDDIYQQRSAAETAFRILKQRFGVRLDSRSWYGQFRELVLKYAMKNIEFLLKAEG